MSGIEELFVWKRTEDGEGQMWCYAGGRRYLFANMIINLKQNKCFGAIYDIDLDNLQIDLSQVNEKDLEEINIIEDDFELVISIANTVESEHCSRITPLYDDEDQVWAYVCSIRE